MLRFVPVRSAVLRPLNPLCLLFVDISNNSFIQFQIWDFPGQIDFFDQTFDSEYIFGGCGALIFVIDAQVSVKERNMKAEGIPLLSDVRQKNRVHNR